MSDADLLVLDSVTRMDERHRGKVLVAGSHGAVYAAYLAALGRLRGVILNDAGVGKDGAGISGLPYLDEAGIAGATVSHASARIGDGRDMLARGVISHVNRLAAALGCTPGMACADCAALLTQAQVPATEPPPKRESRFRLPRPPGRAGGLGHRFRLPRHARGQGQDPDRRLARPAARRQAGDGAEIRRDCRGLQRRRLRHRQCRHQPPARARRARHRRRHGRP